jgi:arsenical pump membrane protein
LTHAAGQVWPAFALVTGLLLVGVVAERDGLFAAAGGLLARVPAGPRVLLVLALGLVAFVTAILNLDTSVFFLTPVLLHLARLRGIDETAFLYGAVFMSNAASLFLPGSNLTNLIVLDCEAGSGAQFFVRMWSAAFASVIVTALVLLALYWRPLGAPSVPAVERAPARLGVGAIAVLVATAVVLLVTSPGLPVLVCGIVAVILARVRLTRVREAVDVRLIGLLFVLAVALGWLGRAWRGPETLVDDLGRVGTAVAAAFSSVAINNLPASVLLAPDRPDHARAFLIGLNLGPNLAITGSLSALLWLRVARGLGAPPSVRIYSLLGLVLVPLSLGAAVGALWLVAPGRL